MTVDAISLRATQISLERGGLQAKIADTGLHLGYAPNWSKLTVNACMSKSPKGWVCSLACGLCFCRDFSDFTSNFRQVCPTCGGGQLCHVRLAATTQSRLVPCWSLISLMIAPDASQKFSMERNLGNLPAIELVRSLPFTGVSTQHFEIGKRLVKCLFDRLISYSSTKIFVSAKLGKKSREKTLQIYLHMHILYDKTHCVLVHPGPTLSQFCLETGTLSIVAISPRRCETFAIYIQKWYYFDMRNTCNPHTTHKMGYVVPCSKLEYINTLGGDHPTVENETYFLFQVWRITSIMGQWPNPIICKY